MKCFECGGEVIQSMGAVRMTKADGSLVIFKDIPLNQCRQCGEQYIPGRWAERMAELMRQGDRLVPHEILSVPVIALG